VWCVGGPLCRGLLSRAIVPPHWTPAATGAVLGPQAPLDTRWVGSQLPAATHYLAARIALFKRTLAIWTLYPFLPSGLAPFTARLAASSATCSLSFLPMR